MTPTEAQAEKAVLCRGCSWLRGSIVDDTHYCGALPEDEDCVIIGAFAEGFLPADCLQRKQFEQERLANDPH